MTEYEKGYIEGMRQAYQIGHHYALDCSPSKAERAMGACSVVHAIELQIEKAKREAKENENA